jgi:cyclopropane fatty-acyl-phospholipid synthase-like methyltransferase
VAAGDHDELAAPPPVGPDGALTDLGDALRRLGTPCRLILPDGRAVSFGDGAPAFAIELKSDLALSERPTAFSLARAYVGGLIDATGDLMALLDLRDVLPNGIPAGQVARLARDVLLPATIANARAIDDHYSFGDDFYLTFLDRDWHFYSQCLFEHEDETLEQAALHKLERMWAALGLEPGMRLLDVGGGWGGLAAYCGERGVHVTSLTLTEGSAAYIRERTRGAAVPAQVVVEDVLDHFPSHPYDHVVIFGVIEHIPNYRRLCERLWAALVPHGRLYVDASATKEKYAASAFTREYTWRGPHSCLVLQDFVQELLFHGFEVIGVRQETRDYELTMRHWAERFDDPRAAVAERFGVELYRAFRLFLWGGAHGFARNRLQAYSVVAERRADAGPRPGSLRRLGHFLGSLR